MLGWRRKGCQLQKGEMFRGCQAQGWGVSAYIESHEWRPESADFVYGGLSFGVELSHQPINPNRVRINEVSFEV